MQVVWHIYIYSGRLPVNTGQQALAAVAREHDGCGRQTVLTAAVCEHCRVEDPLDLLGCVQPIYESLTTTVHIARWSPRIQRA